MNEIIIIAGLFLEFMGGFKILYDDYVVGKITSRSPDLLVSVEKISGRARQRTRKNGSVALVLGFIVLAIGYASPSF